MNTATLEHTDTSSSKDTIVSKNAPYMDRALCSFLQLKEKPCQEVVRQILQIPDDFDMNLIEVKAHVGLTTAKKHYEADLVTEVVTNDEQQTALVLAYFGDTRRGHIEIQTAHDTDMAYRCLQYGYGDCRAIGQSPEAMQLPRQGVLQLAISGKKSTQYVLKMTEALSQRVAVDYKVAIAYVDSFDEPTILDPYVYLLKTRDYDASVRLLEDIIETFNYDAQTNAKAAIDNYRMGMRRTHDRLTKGSENMDNLNEDWTQEAEDKWRAKMARHDAELALVRKQREEALLREGKQQGIQEGKQQGKAQLADDLCSYTRGHMSKEEFILRNAMYAHLVDIIPVNSIAPDTTESNHPQASSKLNKMKLGS